MDPYRLGHRADGRAGAGAICARAMAKGGPASKRVIVGYGFWIFLLSDIVMFSCFFAAYAVLQTATAGGPSGRDLFDPDARRDGDRGCSSRASPAACRRSRPRRAASSGRKLCLLVTGLLGLAFLVLEAQEFAGMIAAGAGPQRSAFLSSFFTVVGCHGLHVTAGCCGSAP